MERSRWVQCSPVRPCPQPRAAAPPAAHRLCRFKLHPRPCLELCPSSPLRFLRFLPLLLLLLAQSPHVAPSAVQRRSLLKLIGGRKSGESGWEVGPSKHPSSHSGVQPAPDQGVAAAGPSTAWLVAGSPGGPGFWGAQSKHSPGEGQALAAFGGARLEQDGAGSGRWDAPKSLQLSGAGDACPAFPLQTQQRGEN